MKHFYKIEGINLKIGTGKTVPDGFIEYTKGEEPQELVNALTPTKEEISNNIKTLVQTHLDKTALEWGYDNIYTAITYIGDPNAEFNTEGIMFRNWRSAVWVYVNAEQQKLKDGLRTIPTDAELIAELPLLDTYK